MAPSANIDSEASDLRQSKRKAPVNNNGDPVNVRVIMTANKKKKKAAALPAKQKAAHTSSTSTSRKGASSKTHTTKPAHKEAQFVPTTKASIQPWPALRQPSVEIEDEPIPDSRPVPRNPKHILEEIGDKIGDKDDNLPPPPMDIDEDDNKGDDDDEPEVLEIPDVITDKEELGFWPINFLKHN
jgi:hypothetical protein